MRLSGNAIIGKVLAIVVEDVLSALSESASCIGNHIIGVTVFVFFCLVKLGNLKASTAEKCCYIRGAHLDIIAVKPHSGYGRKTKLNHLVVGDKHAVMIDVI